MITIIVKGRPVSINSSSKNKARWKNIIIAEARKVCAAPVNDGNLSITITFFYRAVPDFDTQNICKPICDALTGVAYNDDNQITKHNSRRVDLNSSFTIENPDPKVTETLADGEEFVCITIKKEDMGVVTI